VFYVTPQAYERLPARVGSLTQGVALIVLPSAALKAGRLPGSRALTAPSFQVSGCVGFSLRSRGRRERRGEIRAA